MDKDEYNDAILQCFLEQPNETILSIKPETKIKIAKDLGLFNNNINNATFEKTDREKYLLYCF